MSAQPALSQRSRATAGTLVILVVTAMGGCATDTQPDPPATNGATAGATSMDTSGGTSNAGHGGTGSSHAGSGGTSGGSGSAANTGGSTAVAGASSGVGGTLAGGANAAGGTTGDGLGGTPSGEAGETGEAGQAGATNADALEAARADYRGWQQRTDEPLNISAQIFSLCRAPTAAEQAFVASEHGDELYLLDWANEEAAATLDAGATAPFPVGAAIVKEKLVRDGDDYVLMALGLMVKREAGFDPPNGDWQFGYWQPEDGMSSGASTNDSCGTCHASSTTDFVFLDETWRLP